MQEVSALEFVQDTNVVNREPLVYLSGAVAPLTATHPLVGIMFQPGMGNRPDLTGTAWSLDNGCYAASQRGEAFDGDAFMRLLSLDYWHRHGATCRFVVAPDVVGDAAGTLRLAEHWLPRLGATGFPVAFVGQDGLDHKQVPWEGFAVFFLGGSTAWKLGADARYICAEARARGKRVHMGRVNSLRRMTRGAFMGCHTWDGTYLAYGPKVNSPRLAEWVGGLAYYRRPAR